jgi:hypothetical protein
MRKQLDWGIGDGIDLVVAAILRTRHVSGVERGEIIQHKLPGLPVTHDLFLPVLCPDSHCLSHCEPNHDRIKVSLLAGLRIPYPHKTQPPRRRRY